MEVGDQVLKIGEVSFELYQSDRALPHFEPFNTGEPVYIEFMRKGRFYTILKRPYSPRLEVLPAITALLFPLVFWVMGTIAVVFLRPRDERWLLLVLFQYDTALWLSSGFLGASRVAYSAILFYVTIWLFLPLSVHLHLILPDSPFRKYHRTILAPLYVSALLFILLYNVVVLPQVVALWSTLLALAISLTLLVLRRFVPAPPATQVASKLMLYGVALALGPMIVLLTLYIVDLSAMLEFSYLSMVIGVFLILSPLWPLTYIYAIYKHDLGTFEFRANRLLGVYGFFSLYITSYIILFNAGVDISVSWGLEVAFFGLALSLLFAALGPLFYARFQRLVDRRVFGVKYRPNEVVSVFAEKIPTAYNRDILKGIILNEILPTLLVRQSALYVFGENSVEMIYEQDVRIESGLPESSDLRLQVAKAGRYISFPVSAKDLYDWVRLVVPLSIQEEAIGVWLLGRRDPDDYYTKSDIILLGNLANQIAPVIENFRLVERAREEVAENRRLQEQLIHSQKMEAIGRLSAGVAHDFNNILSVIIGYSNLILAQYREDSTLQQSIKNIQDAGERAAGLTKQLLAFSRQQVMEAKVTDVNAIVADVEKMLRRLAGEDIELITDLSSELPNIKIDPGQMGQVIINLAVNARDAMPDGGRIIISTQSINCGEVGVTCHDRVPPGLYVLLRVEDTGAGIDPDVQARMFEPYFTTKDLGKGTGLGLSMVYGIINQSKGYIFVDSKLGEGAVFSVYLPAVTAEEVDRERLAKGLAVPHSGTETILLVEDEQSVRAVTSEILQSNGYKVIESRDGKEALRDFEFHRGTIDMLLTDVVMPRMKGPELASRLLGAQPKLKVIYMSGYNEEGILGQRIGEDGSVLIQKPFSPQTLARKVREVLDGGDSRDGA
ncbi:MAG: response regulator [bacterium]|nr:response regulator [bacterium]